MDGKIAYDGQLLAGLKSDLKLHDGFIKSLIIAFGVVLLSVPIGMAAAIILTQVKSNLRNIFYSISIMPVLFPGVIIGISTVVLWDRLATLGGESILSEIGRNGIFLTILAQTCFISTYCFLIFVARMQRFDQTQEEAALDLGASQTQVFFKVLIPYLVPAIASASVIAFLASFENYNTTVFSILSDQTLTTVIASKVRLGISPAISALAFAIIVLTVSAAIIYILLKKREEKNLTDLQDEMVKSNSTQSRINKDYKLKFKVPRGIITMILILITGSYIFSQILKNDLYGQSCIDASDKTKKSKFLQQLEILENNQGSDEQLQGGTLGGTNDYGDIFGDPNLFNEYGFGE
jgi:spermidine/putrescine transport system permease protein